MLFRIRVVPPRRAFAGFTLVELLIVVAIIGVLSTVAVPTFRRMVQKSKQVEAKLHLASLYRLESTFASEFGAYGDHITAMGFEVVTSQNHRYDFEWPSLESEAWAQFQGNPPTGFAPTGSPDMLYQIGFPGSSDCSMASSVNPPLTFSGSDLIMATLPKYYTADAQNNGCGNNGNNKGNCSTTSGYGTSVGRTTAKLCAISGAPGTPTVGVYSSPLGQYDRYTAVASGVIAFGVNRDQPSNVNDLDIWTIDQDRTLRNTNSGIQ